MKLCQQVKVAAHRQWDLEDTFSQLGRELEKHTGSAQSCTKSQHRIKYVALIMVLLKYVVLEGKFSQCTCIWDTMFQPRPSLLLRCFPFSIIHARTSGGGLEPRLLLSSKRGTRAKSREETRR